ncbi:MAG: phage tail tape measure protein, partial [Cyanobacteria bacterium J06626_23]
MADTELRIKVSAPNAQQSAKQIGQLQSEINKTTKAAQQLAKLADKKIVLEANLNKFSAEIKAVDAKLKALQDKRIKVSADTGASEAEIANLDAQIARLQSRRVKLDVDTRNAANELASVTQEANELANELNQVETSADQARQELADLALISQGLQDVAQVVGQGGDKLLNLSNNARAAADSYDAARNAASTLVDDVDALEGKLDGVANSLGNQVSKTELLASSYDILSAGFTNADDAAQVLEASSRGAIAGFSSTATVADALTTILNAYNLTADDAAAITDQFVQTQNKGKITVDQYAQGIGAVASIASTAGVDITELNAVIATSTSRGVLASSAISGTRQALVNLLKPTKDGKETLAEFGIQNAEAALKSEGLIGILQRLADQGATTQQLSEIFSDVDSLAVISSVAGENVGLLQENLVAIGDSAGIAGQNLDDVANSSAADFNAAFNQLNDELVDIGRGVQASLVPLIEILVKLLQAFSELPAPVKEAVGVLTLVTGGALSVVAALGSIAATLPVVIGGVKTITAAFGAKAVAAGTAATATTAAGTAAGAAVPGVAALGTALAGLQAKLVALAPLLVVVGAAVAAIKFTQFTEELADNQRQLEEILGKSE